MRNNLPTLSVFISFVLCITSSPANGQREALGGLAPEIERALEDWDVPGLALSVVHSDSIVYARGFGVRQVGRSDPVNARTIFAIGSASKAFTTAALGMLVDEGSVRWDDAATTHLPSFQLFDPYATREMTVRDLVTHRSGLSRGDLMWYGSDYSRDEIVRRVRYLEPSWSFRSRFGYQNIMYLAAGEIVEALSGFTWDDFVTQRIFSPLGMDESSTSVRDLEGLHNVASPHAKVDGAVVPVAWRNIDNVAAAGSINSNVIDMAQWVRLQLGEGAIGSDRLLSSGVISEMHTPQAIIRREGAWAAIFPDANFLTYGMGWFLYDYRGRKVVAHGGNIDGMSALVAMIPDEDVGLVILTNMNGTLLTSALASRVFDRFLGYDDKEWNSKFLATARGLEQEAEAQLAKVDSSRVLGTSPSLATEAYVGTYHDSLYGALEIEATETGLVARYGAAFVGDLEHWHYDTFRATWRDPILGKSMISFTLNSDGEVAELTEQNLGDFVRLPAEEDASAIALSVDQLRRFMGSYRSETLPVAIGIELVGDALKANVPGQPTYTLIPISETRFKLDGAPPGFYIEFLMNGGPIKMTLEQPQGNIELVQSTDPTGSS